MKAAWFIEGKGCPHACRSITEHQPTPPEHHVVLKQPHDWFLVISLIGEVELVWSDSQDITNTTNGKIRQKGKKRSVTKVLGSLSKG